MEMFRFANPNVLYALVIVLVFILLYIYSRIARKRAIKRFGNPETIASLMPNVSNFRPALKFGVAMFALSMIIIAMARPQYGSKLQKTKREGIEVIIALDVSNSMMAEDIQPNRLERSKRAISRLTERLVNDKIGLVVFAGDAYTQIPITTDYASAKMFLSAINTSVVPKQGTAIGAAINLAAKSFTPNSEASKAIIVITDGENHEDDAVGAATAAAEAGIVVHTIGMGLPQGGPIPVSNSYGQKDFRRDKEGSVIITKLDEGMLQKISQAGGGAYIRANNTEVGINQIFDEINKMEKKELETRVYSDYNDQFMIFLFIAFFALIIDFMLLERRNKYLKKVHLFKSGHSFSQEMDNQ